MADLQLNAKYQEAVALHSRIMATGKIVTDALVGFCAELKKMRDSGLYTELGFATFDSYVEGAVGLKSRMAYNYIRTYERMGAEQLAAHSEVGITKLSLIAGLTGEERAEVLEENDLTGMSTAEVKALVAKVERQTQQLCMLEDQLIEEQRAVKSERENKAAADKRLDELTRKLQEAQSRLMEESREVDAAVYAQAKEDAERELAARYKEEMALREDAARQKAQTEAEARLRQEVEQAKKNGRAEGAKAAQKQMEEARQRAQRLEEAARRAEGEKAAAEQRARALEKELAVSGSREVTEFMLLFDQLQQTRGRMLEVLAKLRADGQTEQADKLQGALTRALAAMGKE